MIAQGMIAQGLIALGFRSLDDFIVQDDGDGPHIKEWLSSEPRPSDEEIAAAIAALPDPLVSAVKAEAARRILAIAPEWKQRNMTARGVELLSLGRENWSQTDIDEAAAMQVVWSRIKAVRAASNALESMDPIPADYADDNYWLAGYTD